MKSESDFVPSNDSRTDKLYQNSQSKPLNRGSKRSNGKVEWQQKVYQINEDNTEKLDEFHTLCNFVFRRDEFSCQACFRTRYKLSQVGLFLTAHHVIPRIERGLDIMDNLLTLCNECHDVIEETKFRTKPEIYGYMTKDKKHWHRDETYGEKWTQWVYGGRRKPK